jgi:hypothetical protein
MTAHTNRITGVSLPLLENCLSLKISYQAIRDLARVSPVRILMFFTGLSHLQRLQSVATKQMEKRIVVRPCAPGYPTCPRGLLETRPPPEEGRKRDVRALLCRCRCRLEADNDENLRELVRDHLRREHPAVAFDYERVRKIVANHSYYYECVEVYASGSELNEEFGPEPY